MELHETCMKDLVDKVKWRLSHTPNKSESKQIFRNQIIVKIKVFKCVSMDVRLLLAFTPQLLNRFG